MSFTTIAALALAATGQTSDEESIFEVGQEVDVKVGGGWRPCTIKDPGAEYRVARATCPEFPTITYTYPAGEEIFQATGSADVRLRGSCTTTSPYANSRAIPNCGKGSLRNRLGTGGAGADQPGATVAPTRHAPAHTAPVARTPVTRPAAAGGGSLPAGEYGCIGAGTTQLAGMGSKLLPGGRYTDLDGKSPGTYKIVGSTIVFTGGHLGGQVGRDIKNNGYTIGKMVSCQKW